MFGRRNQVVYVLSVLPGRPTRFCRGGGRKAIEPGLYSLSFKADEAMNTTAWDFILRNPEVECGRLDIEPSRKLFDGKHVQIHRGSLPTPPSPPNMGCPRDRRQAGETEWVVA